MRHKGFIPWDNDVDIAMPRPDYERLTAEFSSEGLSLHCLERQKDWHYPFVKITDDKTLVIEKCFRKREIGVWIDVFPIDGFPSTKAMRRTALERRLLLYCSAVRLGAKPKKLYRAILKTIVQIILWIFPKQFFLRAIKKCTTRYGWEGQPYAAVSCGNMHKENMPMSCAQNFVDVEFEGRKYKAFQGWDTYLTNSYGDYMTLPPEEERITHPIQAFWK